MISKDKKKIRKEKERYNRIKRKEYSKDYLKIKDKRTQEQHSYPKVRLVMVRDFLRSKDLRKSVGLFLGSQLSIVLLLVGVNYPTYFPLISVLSMIVGAMCIVFSVMEINKRQRRDITRKPVDGLLVFKILILSLLATTALSILFEPSGLSGSAQPNQQAINDTLKLFPIPMMFTVLIVAPVVEEVIFRELLPYASGPSYLSFVFASLLFVVVHTPSGMVGWIGYGITAIGFLSARLINNNVYTGILVHLLWNMMSLFL